MDRGTWQATVHGFANDQVTNTDTHAHTHTHIQRHTHTLPTDYRTAMFT